MIDPVNPGPAGSTGPAGGEAGIGPPGDITPLLSAGTAVIGQAMSAVTGAIQSLFNQAFQTVQGAISKAATAISTGYNTAETALVSSGSVVQANIATATPTATGLVAPGGPAVTGSKPAIGNWNVFQFVRTPYPTRFIQNTYIPGVDMLQWCYRGGWPNVDDAAAYSLAIDGKRPPDWCYPPGGPATGTPAGTGPTGCELYQVYQQTVDNNIIGCGYVCAGTPLPSGGVAVGNPVPQDIAAGLLQTLACTGGTGTTGGPGPQYWGGCGPDGTPVAWQIGAPEPQGVTGQAGPFGDMSSALAAVKCSPPLVPPNQPPTGAGGPCCDPVTGEVKLPKCIYFDLCDWEKFKQAMRWAIYKGLCDFIQDPDCYCKVQDGDKYLVEDCDGEFAKRVDDFYGRTGSVFTRGGGIDEYISKALETIGTAPDDSVTPPDPWG
jgi:hypothetical protein